MKICWDTLEQLKYIKKSGLWRDKTSYKYVDSCLTCKEPFLANVSNRGEYCCNKCKPSSMTGRHQSDITRKLIKEKHLGKKLSEEHKKKLSIAHTGKRLSELHKKNLRDHFIGDKSHLWKGGVKSKNIPLYDTYAQQIYWCESVRRNPDDNNILQVKCTYCGKWYIPKASDICNRRNALNGKVEGEQRLYCSSECKELCPIFRKKKYSAEETHTKQFSREVQAELRQLVFERDQYECVKCNNRSSLQCHHIEGIRWEPLQSADIDKCITLCKSCHQEVHMVDGCRPIDMICM